MSLFQEALARAEGDRAREVELAKEKERRQEELEGSRLQAIQDIVNAGLPSRRDIQAKNLVFLAKLGLIQMIQEATGNPVRTSNFELPPDPRFKDSNGGWEVTVNDPIYNPNNESWDDDVRIHCLRHVGFRFSTTLAVGFFYQPNRQRMLTVKGSLVEFYAPLPKEPSETLEQMLAITTANAFSRPMGNLIGQRQRGIYRPVYNMFQDE